MANKTITPLLPKHILRLFQKLNPAQRKDAMEKILKVEITLSKKIHNGGARKHRTERFFSAGPHGLVIPIDRDIYDEWDVAMGKFDLGSAKYFRIISTDRMRVELLLMTEG